MVATERPAQPRGAPIARLIEFCARRPVYTLFVVFCLAFSGYRSLQTIALDAIPDLSDVQVIVLTEWLGRSPDLVEDQITYPLTSNLLAAPKVQSMAGLAAEMGLIMLFYLDHSLRQAEAEETVRDRGELLRALTQGAGQRVRPMLMTSITLLVSLVPVMVNEGTGSDVMKRIAAPMVGGISTALIVVLLLMPSAFALRKAYYVPAERTIRRTVEARVRECANEVYCAERRMDAAEKK